MNSDLDLMNLPFDLFTRDFLIQKLINSIRKNNDESLKILDVGGRAGNLRDFLPNDEIYILDIRRGEESNYVIGDISHAPYKDFSFDVVVSSDVYEHIPNEDREKVVHEMLRISKNYIILGAPFESKEVADAEIKACNYFREIVGEPHPWLKEHIENGLPSQKKFEEFLQSTGVDFLTIKTNNVSNWLLFQLFIFYAYKYGIPAEKVSRIYRYYNENFIDLGDFLEPTYRKIYLFSKKEALPKIDFRSSGRKDLVKYHTLQALIFETLGELTDSRDTHIHNLESIINQNNKQIALQIETAKGKENQIVALNEVVQDRENQISALDEAVQKKDAQIIKQRTLIAENNRILNDIQSSTTWQLLTKYQSLVDRTLPISTKRRSTYDLGILSLRILVKDGFRAFFYKIQERYGKKDLDLSNIPMFETNVTSSVEPLSLAKPLCGQFTFVANNLNEIKIFTATYQRKNSDLEFQIMDSEGHLLRKEKIKGYRVLDNDYTSFKFKPITDSKGKTFFFKITSKGKTDAAIWHSKNGNLEGLDLYYNNQPLKGSISFQAFADLGMKSPYDLWILKNEPDEAKLEQYKTEIQNFNYQPKISVVTPVYNPDVAWIKAAIESIRNQVYQNWELCLADASTKEDVRNCLETYAKKDSRIKVKSLSENKGISGNSNEARFLATGEYIGLLDHDDELSPDALYEVVKHLQDNPRADMIYSDEDKINLDGKRQDAFFKPDWAEDMFLAHNYLCHFTVIKKDIVEKVGGFREGYDGSQDYDLFLRATEVCNKIGHIPKILYHWRIVPGSTSENLSRKSYALTATKKALESAIQRRGLDAEVEEGLFPNSSRVKYNIAGNPKISIIIPTKDKVEVLKTCIESVLEKTDYQNYELIIIDNQSSNENTFDYYKKLSNNPKIRIIEYPEKFNFSAINNFAVSKTESEYIVFLNNDTEVISGEWLSSMLEHAQRKEVGAVGAKLVYSNNTVQHAGIVIGIVGNPPVGGHSHKHFPKTHPGYFGRIQHISDVSAVTAACMMIRKEVFEEVGGFDEENLAIAFNDVDLCLKIRQKGYLIVYTPYAELYHHESLSRGYEDTPEKQARFVREVRYMREKWGKVIDKGDPYYSPNLTLENEDFSTRV